MDGQRPTGPVVVYDDDHYYMASVIAELLRGAGHEVTLATSAPLVANWTQHNLEQGFIERRLVEQGVRILTRHRLKAVGAGEVELVHDLDRRAIRVPGQVVPVTMRLPDDELYHALIARGVANVRRIGDCFGPSVIAAAVYEGHRYARELDTDVDPDRVPFRRDVFHLDRPAS
jgi:dimethylamine/trimethylamine dehydrogenase